MTNHKIKKIENETEIDRILNKVLRNDILPIRYVEVGDDKICLPEAYSEQEEKLKSFTIREDDVFVIGHPKTGTTWCQEMVWLISNNLDYEKAKSEFIIKRFPILEASVYYQDPHSEIYNIWKDIDPLMLYEYIPSPRFFKSHLPWFLLPDELQTGAKKPKVIYITRKPHDVCVSYFHHLKKYGLTAALDKFAELFLAGRVVGSPFDKSVLSFWEQRKRENILFLNFHDLKKDLKGAIKKVANFLDKSLTDEEIEELANFIKFENMKTNPSSNCLGLIRTGEVGGYKKEMSEELIEKFDEWEKEKFAGTDIAFD